MISFLKIFSIALLVVLLHSISTDKVWPRPINMSVDANHNVKLANPCQITYNIQAPSAYYAEQIIGYYQTVVFKCTAVKPGKISLRVVIKNVDILIPTDVSHERYTLNLYQNDKWELTADYYPGFLRAFETYSQLFEINNNGQYEVIGLPIKISDEPSFKWRGLMIDTSRHFLPIPTIKKAIDSMLFSKLNVLHWHIIDQDAFPMEVPAVPELSQGGKVGGTYSVNDIKSIIAYAKGRGIRVIPEVDTPAHTQSWGRSEKYKTITLNCNGIYQGQLDPSNQTTWDVVTEVMKYINQTFVDDYVHFGGDEVVYECWGKRESIVKFMKDNNISDYKQLAIYFRSKQKTVWRTITPKKKVIYWANQDIDLPLQDEDVIQWWGVSSNVGKMVGRKNEVILSNYDLTYLDIGFGNFYGNKYGTYQSWRKMYAFQPRVDKVNVIGGQSCMWNQIGTKHTFEQKVVQRSSVTGQRLWNVKLNIATDLKNIATRLTAHTERLRNRGFKVWPVTVGICQKQMDICFH